MEEPFQTTDDCQKDHVILPDGWRGILDENNRWFYLQETKKIFCWLPPIQAWRSRRGLPYGWESARSNDGRRYYINHLSKETIRCLPSSSNLTASVTPRTRKIVISRHAEIGYGFVAGSEKPVLIRSVAEDGPSAGKLHANDQILKINDEDVYDLPQADVILRIKHFTQELQLEVIANDDVQDVKNKSQRKSSIISRTTREKRRSNPVSVRFAETPVLIQYVGSPSSPFRRSSLPLLPNVLKIFLENGQTRSFRYDSSTTVKELYTSLGEKIGLKKLDRFSLVLQSSQSLNDSYVQPNERAAQIYLRRSCSSSTWLCKFNLVLAPKDIHFLLKEDPIAFDYFYKQVCSQVVGGRFGWELKYETAIKLAALQLQQYALEDKGGKGPKISVKAIEKEVGSLDNFVPKALINTMQKKDLQRVLTQQIKQTRNLCPPGQKYISPLQAKLQYLKIVSEMKMYGGKQFNAIIHNPTEDPKFFQDEKLLSIIFVGPNVGLAQVTNPKSFSMNQIAAFNQINGLVVTPHTGGKQNVKLFLINGKSVTLILGPIYETRDLVYLISGYCKYFIENTKSLSMIDMTGTEIVVEESFDEVPSYSKTHRVLPDKWNYKEEEEQENSEVLKDIDFLQKPKFVGSEQYSVVTKGSEDPEPSSQEHVCNGDVKSKNVAHLEHIVEEHSSPQKKDVGELINPEKVVDDVDGLPVGKKSVVRLIDNLRSESTDEDVPEESTKILESNKSENVTSEFSDMTDSESLTKDDLITTSIEHAEIDIIYNNDDDSISSHQTSGDNSVTTPSVSPTSNDSGASFSLSSSENDVTIPLPDLKLNDEQDESNLRSDEVNKSSGGDSINNDKNVVIEKEIPTKQVITTDVDSSDHNRLEENTLRNFSPVMETILIDIKRNGVKTRPRRRSSGYIPETMNGDIHLFTPECIILDNTIPKPQKSPSKESKSKEAEITSRSEACNHALKLLYTLKTKLSLLLHSKLPVRTTNEILRDNKQLIVDKIVVLEECIKQIKKLSTTEQKKIVETVLRSSRAFDQLTASCTMLYNAQYSMRHFTTELDDAIDKHIDVLITTDTWNSTKVFDMTVELHKDKCDLVLQALNSLRKTTNIL